MSPTSNATATVPSPAGSTQDSSSGRSVSNGAIVGMFIGAVAAFFAVAFANWFFVLRKRLRNRTAGKEPHDESESFPPGGITETQEKEASLSNRYEAVGDERAYA